MRLERHTGQFWFSQTTQLRNALPVVPAHLGLWWLPSVSFPTEMALAESTEYPQSQLP